MTLDAEVHHLGTKFIHGIPPWIVYLAGYIADSAFVMGAGTGMFLLLAVGLVRHTAHYRWRAGTQQGGDSE